MKRLQLLKNKFALVVINVTFIAIWEVFTGLILENIFEKIYEFEFFNQESFLVLLIEILFLILPILPFTYWIWSGKNYMTMSLNERLNTTFTSCNLTNLEKC